MVETTQEEESKSNNGLSWKHFPLGLLCGVIMFAIQRNAQLAQDPLIFMIPNLFLFTPYRGMTHQLWQSLLKYNTSHEIPLIPIPELTAEEFSFEALRNATNHWRHPVVVRGLFANTTAVQKWHERDYVSSNYLGRYDIVMLERGLANGLENERQARYVPFQEAWPEILDHPETTKYLFFPERSRSKKGNESALFRVGGDTLPEKLNRMVRDDLDVDRIWPGFGNRDTHPTYMGAQFIAGWGQPSMESTTGSNWHCAPGNNWFVQVHGRKQWRFVDAAYSAWMHPQRDGVYTMATSHPHMTEMEKYIPVQYVDLEAGDLVYNPDFQWHAIRNYEGLSIGVPLREANKTLTLQNNFQYAVIMFINGNLAHWFGFTYGLQPHLKKK